MKGCTDLKKRILITLALAMLLAAAAVIAQAAPANMPYSANCSVYYQTLSGGEKDMFDRVYDALYRGDREVTVPKVCTKDQAWLMLNQMFNECPELCAFDPDHVRYDVTSAGKVYRLQLSYKRSIQDQRAYIAKISGITRNFRCFGDVLRYVCDTISYDRTSTDNGRMFAYEGMQRGRGVCNAYAQIVAMLCHFSGIECSYIDGTANGGGHAWNVVGQNGLRTLVDVTWADINDKRCNYDWIGLSTAEMGASHTQYADRFTVPPCVNMRGALCMSSQETVLMNYGNLYFMLRSGDRDSEVRRVQQRLYQLGYLRDKPDGVYGAKTQRAVADFQAKNGIHGVTGTSGVASKLTQAALYSDRAVPASGAARIAAWSWTGSRSPVTIGRSTVRLNGASGSLSYELHNENPRQAIVAVTVRYWADGADGSLVYPVQDTAQWSVTVPPGQTRTLAFEFIPDDSLRRAALVKWNVIEVQFADGEVFISENLSAESPYIIRTNNRYVNNR